MKVTLTDLNGKVHKLKPHEGASTVATELTCPHCGAENIFVAGMGKSIDPDRRHDTYRADAAHDDENCRGRVGVLRVRVNTLFGIEEDERVLNGRCRIY